jgi:large subunit ribosomal protein L6
MSRVAKNPITIPKDVEVGIEGQSLRVKGPKGQLEYRVHALVEAVKEGNELRVSPRGTQSGADAQAGTTRAVVNNMVIGVSAGFSRKLELVGVGYRAQAQGKVLNLTLGFSHPASFKVPEEITVETPTPTEIIVRGASKQQVGQVAANIRAFRSPEPYKGKGVRYSDEVIVRKEAKKK